MLAKLESIFHRFRRRLSASERTIRRLGLEGSENTGEEPGLLLLQIDGLSREEVERAIQQGRMPFLKRLLRGGGYTLQSFYSGLPSTTPAVQAELYYGVRAGVPAFSFMHRARGEISSMFSPDLAREFEAKFAAEAEGLLKGGSSWSNIYAGGARKEESHFCISSMGLGGAWPVLRLGRLLMFLVMQFPTVMRIAALMLLELPFAVVEAIFGILQGRHAMFEAGMVISRTCIAVGLRELVIAGGKVDVARGLPVVHVNFLGYDEMAHRRGPASRFAWRSLPGIDRALERLYRAAIRSQRRDYHVWIFSDHGQETSWPYPKDFPGGLHESISACLDLAPGLTTAPARPHSFRPLTARQAERWRKAERKHSSKDAPFQLAAMGPVGHVYFKVPPDDVQKKALARKLVEHGRVPGVLHRTLDGTITWHHARGETDVPDGVAERLRGHPAGMRSEIARDLVDFCKNEHCGDLILLGWSPERSLSFLAERGAHAGPGLHEVEGFLAVPRGTRMPETAVDFVRPSALRRAAMHLLGREHLEAPETPPPRSGLIRVVSYNVHACAGMDGRISPRRIARIIQQIEPDIVALQELDEGRPRSRRENQAIAIAEMTGMHVVFCPTVVRSGERYGHAVLSRYPIESVKVGNLPIAARSIWPEPRGALWSRISLDGQPINVVTTHLGLSPRERIAQMKVLLGSDWLGPVAAAEPAILCGDFNCTPQSRPMRFASSLLRDVTLDHSPGPKTFASNRPFTRIDHILTSSHFAAKAVFCVRNELTRLASDHLPLVADLKLVANA